MLKLMKKLLKVNLKGKKKIIEKRCGYSESYETLTANHT